MPSKVKVRIFAARDLPVMDKQSKLTDAYVQVKLGEQKEYETDVCKKTLNPVWNEDLRVEITDDIFLQDVPLEFRVLDKDIYSADDSIGLVTVDLSPLLRRDAMDTISGWFPIFDTLRGVRGQLHLTIKAEFFSDVDPVRFFCVSTLDGYEVVEIHGFVEELIVEDDPEFHWVDTFRTSRTSNESRQQLFNVLSNQIRRNVGRKAKELGGNTVLAYHQRFDLEEENGIVIARGYGTACTVRPVVRDEPSPVLQPDGPVAKLPPPALPSMSPRVHASPPHSGRRHPLSQSDSDPLLHKSAIPDSVSPAAGILATPDEPAEESHYALQQSQGRSSTEFHHKGSVFSSVRSLLGGARTDLSARLSRKRWEKGSVELLSISTAPTPGFHVQLGSVVSAKAIKLLDSKNAHREAHDEWWTDVRDEIRSHARALNCTTVLGYAETTTIFEDVCVLSASGTACVLLVEEPAVRLHHVSMSPPTAPAAVGASPMLASAAAPPAMSPLRGLDPLAMTTPVRMRTAPSPMSHAATPHDAADPSLSPTHSSASGASEAHMPTPRQAKSDPIGPKSGSGIVLPASAHPGSLRLATCQMCHVPYPHESAPFDESQLRCRVCFQGHVPEVILATIEPPEGLPIVGSGNLVEARVCRTVDKKVQGHGEASAKLVSDAMPFLEYDLHAQLITKLRVMGMNAAFALHFQLTVGEDLIVAVASATAVYVPALPPPPAIAIHRNIATRDAEDETFEQTQRWIEKLCAANQNYWQRSNGNWHSRNPFYLGPHRLAPQRRGIAGPPRTTSLDDDEDDDIIDSETADLEAVDDEDDDGDDESKLPEEGPTPLSQAKRRRSKSQTSLDEPDGASPGRRRSSRRGSGHRSRRHSRRDSESGTLSTSSSSDIVSPVARSMHRSQSVGDNNQQTQVEAAAALKNEHVHQAANSMQPTSQVGRTPEYPPDKLLFDPSEVAKELGRSSYVMHIDDDADEDIMAVLLEPRPPRSIHMCTAELPPDLRKSYPGPYTPPGTSSQQLITAIRRVEWTEDMSHRLNQALATVFHDLHAMIAFKMRRFAPCYVSALRTQVHLPHSNTVEVVLTAMCIRVHPTSDAHLTATRLKLNPAPTSARPSLLLGAHSPRSPSNAHASDVADWDASSSSSSSSSDEGSSSDDDDDDLEEPPLLDASENKGSRIAPRLLPEAYTPAEVTAKLLEAKARRHSAARGSLLDARRDSVDSTARHEPRTILATLTKAQQDERDAQERELPPRDGDFGLLDPARLFPQNDGANGANGAGAASPSLPPQRQHTGLLPAERAKSSHDATKVRCTALSMLPGFRVVRYLGPVNLTFIKEIWSLKKKGGIGAFVHTFLAEVNAVARAHVAARGGNALLAYNLNECKIYEPSANQAYSIISLSGDAAEVVAV